MRPCWPAASSKNGGRLTPKVTLEGLLSGDSKHDNVQKPGTLGTIAGTVCQPRWSALASRGTLSLFTGVRRRLEFSQVRKAALLFPGFSYVPYTEFWRPILHKNRVILAEAITPPCVPVPPGRGALWEPRPLWCRDVLIPVHRMCHCTDVPPRTHARMHPSRGHMTPCPELAPCLCSN
jgi:hypothetical protein